ncbi:MAG: metal ABC transporter ATP-binding protein [Armatimonadetes bacterium]|nr:metal ABC transporter ATP-binding protein [Armatimonadota bacterium]MDW8154276.1 metal ABC transporter ATP-binding protein [Armatimonadota bacterium]
MVELHQVCVERDGERILEDVDLVVHRGDFLGIIGPNGAGKTTLLRVMLGLVSPSRGLVRLFGEDLRSFRSWHRIGYVPQRSVPYEARLPATVLEVVLSGRIGRVGLGRRFTRADREAAERALLTVGMERYRDRPVARLSAGQQQRVQIARALATEPELLILDEPTVGVDVEAQEQFYGLLHRLNGEGVTLVLVSHDIGVVAREVTQLACLNRRLFFHGSPQEALRSGALERLYPAGSWLVAHRH